MFRLNYQPRSRSIIGLFFGILIIPLLVLGSVFGFDLDLGVDIDDCFGFGFGLSLSFCLGLF